MSTCNLTDTTGMGYNTCSSAPYAHTEEARYIIGLNKTLLEKNTSLEKTISEKTTEIDVVEVDLGRRESQVTYMRGLLKNFVAINESRTKISRFRGEILRDQENLLNRYESLIRNQNRLLDVYSYTTYAFLAIVYMEWSSYFIPLLCLCTFGFQMWSGTGFKNTNKIFTRIKTRKLEKEVKITEETKEVDKIERACDFLNEYIDQI